MRQYRRNIDERLRKLQREVFGGDVNSHALLLAERLRSGFISREEIGTAAHFNHPAALQILGMERVTFKEFYNFLDSSTKDITISWAHCVANRALSIWNACMIRRSSESSEETALNEISLELRYMIEAPERALAGVQDWLDGEEGDTDALEASCNVLGEISGETETITPAAITAIVAILNSAKATLATWDSRVSLLLTARRLLLPETDEERLELGTGRQVAGSRRCNFYARECYKHTIRALMMYTNCSVEEAADELNKTILNSMFPSL